MKKIPSIVLAFAALALLLLVVGGPGARLGVWEFGTGFFLMRIAFFLGAGVAALALLLLAVPKLRQTGAAALGCAFVIAAVAAWVPWSGLQTARSVPRIHDITTDTVNPPSFVDVVPLRADARNPVDYEGEAIAAQQREAYPDIQTLELTISAEAAFERAVAAARAQGWEMVAEVAADGRIEASATTFWYGFVDDVVIRILPNGDGSTLDIRSKSRVGLSDVGANAARIRSFVADFNDRG